jgi:hypothetical protein
MSGFDEFDDDFYDKGMDDLDENTIAALDGDKTGGLMDQALEKLQQVFGFSSLKEGQSRVIGLIVVSNQTRGLDRSKRIRALRVSHWRW